jgi:predicted nucleic acid-binding Zn ribbon protein
MSDKKSEETKPKKTKCVACDGVGWYGSLDVVEAMQGNPPTTCHVCNGERVV